jgi:hypothetical protein
MHTKMYNRILRKIIVYYAFLVAIMLNTIFESLTTQIMCQVTTISDSDHEPIVLVNT